MTRLAPLAVALLVVTVAPVGVVTADGDGLDGLFDNGEDAGTLDQVRAFVSGLIDRLTAVGDDTDAETAAETAREAFRDHDGDFQEWANDRTTATTDADVLAITFEVDGETETEYITADVNGSDYANVTMVDETDRPVDETCTLEGHAAQNADAEIDRFHDEVVAPDGNVTEADMARLAAEYGAAVDCTFEV